MKNKTKILKTKQEESIERFLIDLNEKTNFEKMIGIYKRLNKIQELIYNGQVSLYHRNITIG